MTNVLVVGVGNIGSRHLQALGLINEKISVWAVDPNNSSIEIAKERFKSIPYNKNIISLKYCNHFDQIDENLDIAIVATTADIRRAVIEEMLNTVDVKYIVFVEISLFF